MKKKKKRRRRNKEEFDEISTFHYLTKIISSYVENYEHY